MSHQSQKSQSFYYASRVLRLNSYLDMHKIFQKSSDPIKEMTETYGLYKAGLHPQIGLDAKDDSIQPIVLGDGVTPRLGSLLAFMTKWQVTSIDPNFRSTSYEGIQRLTLIKNKCENLGFKRKNLILFIPHGHINLEEFLYNCIYDTFTIVSMPCCEFYKQSLRLEPVLDYCDKYVLSPQNRILVYKG